MFLKNRKPFTAIKIPTKYKKLVLLAQYLNQLPASKTVNQAIHIKLYTFTYFYYHVSPSVFFIHVIVIAIIIIIIILLLQAFTKSESAFQLV